MNPHNVHLREGRLSEHGQMAPAASMEVQADRVGWHPLLPAFLLRAEPLVLFASSALLYFYLGGPWLLLVLLFLAPDLSMLGYLVGKRLGAMTYNLFHSYVLPLTLAGVGLLVPAPMAVLLALIWFAHIALDRTLGYGLKHASGFRNTHLGIAGSGDAA